MVKQKKKSAPELPGQHKPDMINKVFVVLGKALLSCALGIFGVCNDAELHFSSDLY